MDATKDLTMGRVGSALHFGSVPTPLGVEPRGRIGVGTPVGVRAEEVPLDPLTNS